jgi:hypothetical protein
MFFSRKVDYERLPVRLDRYLYIQYLKKKTFVWAEIFNIFQRPQDLSMGKISDQQLVRQSFLNFKPELQKFSKAIITPGMDANSLTL